MPCVLPIRKLLSRSYASWERVYGGWLESSKSSRFRRYATGSRLSACGWRKKEGTHTPEGVDITLPSSNHVINDGDGSKRAYEGVERIRTLLQCLSATSEINSGG